MIQLMRKMIVLRTAAALALALTLSACGGASADSTTPASGTSATAPAATTAAAPVAEAAAADESAAMSADLDFQRRHCFVGRRGRANVSFCASNYSISQAAGAVSVLVTRSGTANAAISVDYSTSNGTAMDGTNYSGVDGTLKWGENDSSPKTITVPINNAKPFSGSKSFRLALSDPSSRTSIGNPGTASVAISGMGAESDGTLQLTEATYAVAQNAGSLTITANRTGGSSGAVSVAYATANGTAAAGKDFTASSGTLKWADGDAAAKSFVVPVSNATPFTGVKTFTVALSNAASGATTGTPDSAIVTITGDKSAAVGSLQLGASAYTVAQNAGKATVAVNRSGGVNGALSVSYAAKSGTAVSGTDFTATTGTLEWADGDSSSRSISIPISNAAPFSGTKSFTVALSGPSAGGTISSPGSATVAIAGDAAQPVGSLHLSAASATILQNAGSATVTVSRTGGSSGAVTVAYAEVNGTAVAGKDYTAASGTLKWADGDSAAKTFAVPISNATPFSGSKSFTIQLSAASGGAALSSPSSAIVSITGGAVAAVGSVQLSASSYTVAQSGGSVGVTVSRTGGSNGAVSVAYAAANGTADAGTDFTAKSGTLTWASGDTSSKSISVAVSNATPFTGSKTFKVALSGPTGGATLSTPSSANVTITGSNVASTGSTLWVYYNGAFNWPGDWSAAASPNYKDTSGGPISGAYDIQVTSQQWGLWQPYVNGNCQQNENLCFDTTPYKYIIFSAKPTVSGQVFQVGFMSKGDTTDGPVVEASAYCSGGANPAVGQWESCKMPLSAFKLTDTTVLKFWIQDQTGLSSNHWYLDNVGFTTN